VKMDMGSAERSACGRRCPSPRTLCRRNCRSRVPQLLQLRLHGNFRAGRSMGAQVHRCAGATLAMTEST
jgi:hypothetical protein